MHRTVAMLFGCALFLLGVSGAQAQEPEGAVTAPPAAPTLPAVSQPLGAPTDSPAANNPRSPVVTPRPGDFALTFLFGGFGSFNVAGVNEVTLGSGTANNPATILFTSIGGRAVLSQVVLTFGAGLGVRHLFDNNDFGLDLSFGVIRGFRAWRRIAPYAGGQMQLTYIDPSGSSNWLVSFALGPVLGVEYFVADRVSVYTQGALMLSFDSFNGGSQINFGTTLRPGGQVGLNFYF